MELNYINAPAGSGKTVALVKLANKMANGGQKVLLVQPTKELINETINQTFPALKVTAPAQQITGTTHHGAVITTLDAYLRNPSEDGEILLITHSAFFGLPHFHDAHKWVCLVDEVPDIQRSFEPNIADEHRIITDYITVHDDEDESGYRKIEPKGTRMREIAANKNKDEVRAYFQEFARTVSSTVWDTYVDAASYDRICKSTFSAANPPRLYVSALLSPRVFEGFRQVWIAGACFTEALLYLVWSRGGATFIDRTASAKLQYHVHPNGNLLDIWFAYEGNSFAKNSRGRVQDLVDGSKSSVNGAIIAAFKGLTKGEPYAAFVNKDISITDPLCTRLPNDSRGMNRQEYQRLDNVLLLSAINPTPAHFRFMERFAGIVPEDVKTALYRQAAYQASARTSIRKHNDHLAGLKKWLVADSETAVWFKKLFPGSRLHPLGIFAGDTVARVGRIEDASKKREQKKSDRKRVLFERTVRLDVVNGVDRPWNNQETTRAIAIREAMVETGNMRRSTIEASSFQATFFRSVGHPVGIVQDGSFDGLATLLREFSDDAFASKDECFLISPAHYVHNPACDKARSLGNVAFARNIILDYDGGDLTPEEFSAACPEWRMIIHSSWSHHPSKPKWRVIIETDCLVDVAGYELICRDIIANRVNKIGYWHHSDLKAKPQLETLRNYSGLHGFDPSHLHAAGLFFLPSKGAHPKHAFFRDYKAGRRPLNVRGVLEHAEGTTPLGEPPAGSQEPKADLAGVIAVKRSNTSRRRKIEMAWDHWRANGDQDHCRERGIWALTCALKEAGCEPAEIISHLDDAVRTTRSKRPSELRQKVQQIVKSRL